MAWMPNDLSIRVSLVALGSGALGAAAFAPVGVWPCSLVSLAVLLVLLRERSPRAAWQIGLLHGLTYGLGTIHWFFGLFGPWGLGLIVLFGCSYALLAWLIALTRGYPPLVRALLTGVIAVALEWARGDGSYLRFPWYTLPHALASAPAWIGIVRWTGVYGLSLVVWTLVGAGAFWRFRAWLGLGLVPLASLLLPAFPAPDQRALLVQQEHRQGIEEVLRELPKEKIDLVVLPELVYVRPMEHVLKLRQGPKQLARRLACPVIFGAPSRDLMDARMENMAVILNGAGKLMGTFTKQHPVPLCADGLPGRHRPVFPLAEELTLGVAVCYDFDAPDIAASLVEKGATVLAAPVSDLETWGRVQHAHHELLLRLRAVENDRWILRAASSGRTEVIDPHGRPSVEGVEIGGPGSIVVSYGHRDTRPLGGRMGILGPVAGGGLVVFLLAHALRLRRLRRQLAALDEAGQAP